MGSYRLAAFFGLSFLSGMFELGVVFRGLNEGHGLLFAFSLALAYQLGTLIPYPIGISRRMSVSLGLGTLTVVALLTATASIEGLWLLPLVLMTSAVINVGRITLGKTEISTTLKRCTRVAGFLCSPLLMQDVVLTVSVVLAIALMSGSVTYYAMAVESRILQNIGSGRRRFATATLFFHQVHYFSYCTVILVMLSVQHNPWLAAAIFVGGWVTYIAAPHIIGQKFEPENVALIGHLVLPFILCGLALVEANTFFWYVLWFLTGPFGGTIVFLTKYARNAHGFDEGTLASVENTGHCVGSALALAWIVAAPPPSGLLFVAAAFAALTAATLTLSSPTNRIASWRTSQ